MRIVVVGINPLPGMDLDSETKDGDGSFAKTEGKTTSTDVFQILSNRRRRYAILFFLYHDPEPDLQDLSHQIAAWENEKSVDRVTTEERRRVYNAFQQFHLPKMDEAGLIEYDPIQHTIESTQGVSVARPYLEVVPGTSLPWCLYYLAFGVISIVLTMAVMIDAVPVPGTVLALVISIVLVVSGFIHVYNEWRLLRRREGHERRDRTN
jgi:hypothetical protein